MSNRYVDEPKCRLCYHAKVVHRGQLHDGECAAIDCPYGCKRFVPSVDSAHLPAAPEKGEQSASHLNNQTQRSRGLAHA
jgi:hypothetical protein